uniref:RNI-like protein n=2 Tax=Kalmanozyma brasiliensis (strain GHG001) TaxID=1365824 RepID=V5ETD3_KALBG
MITVVSPVRRSVYKRKLKSKPKGILKPAPPPQKGFSFRRDILQNINTRLAQQGVNVQVPVPQGSTAQATANYLGGMFRRIGGMAAGAAANVSGSNATAVGGFLSNDPPSKSNGSQTSIYDGAVHSRSSSSSTTLASSSASIASASQATESENGSANPLVKTTVAASTTSAAPLKKVQFQVSHMTVTYPIVGAGTPEDEDLTRLRIEREHRRMLKARRGKPWTPEELEALYRECCRTREEHPLKKMRLVFQEAAQSAPPALKTMDLSFVPLDRHAVEPIADLLSVDFGLNKLVLENCALTDDTVKSILHALLVSGTLPNLSLASNRKIRFRGWRFVAIFMRRARALRYLDLSENSIDRMSLEHLLAVVAKPPAAVTHQRMPVKPSAASAKADANGTSKPEDPQETDQNDDNSDDEFFDDSGEPLMPTAPLLRDVSDDPDPPSSAIISLRLENCGLKAASLELLSQTVRYSDIRHLSLRRNKIGQLASVALAIMLKDYPDSVGALEPITTSATAQGTNSYFDPAVAPDRAAADGQDRSGRTLRPSDAQSTPERRQRSYSPGLPEVPVIVSSPGGGITSRKMPPAQPDVNGAHTEQLQDAMQTQLAGATSPLPTPQLNPPPNLTEAEAVSLYQAKRARRILADYPRVGNLLTLDLKSNDIRGGVVYLAQVLKKNRTLRVLNLSDNNIEVPGLVSIAEALKYNSTLETLDLSHNPCAGPSLEGITTLRTAFALNSNLKRLFLNDTDLTSEAAIALAEFLPEARSLIHLDLAENAIDIAGVLALAVSLRMNRSLRCLDLNIPPNNPDFARLSQEILQSCVRNTELAQQRATKKGLKQPVAAPIYKSVVARAAREAEERVKAAQVAKDAAAKDRVAVEELLAAASECRKVLAELLVGEEARQREKPEETPPARGEFVGDLTRQSAKLRRRLASLASTTEEEGLLGRILTLHDELGEVSVRLETMYRSAGPVDSAEGSTSVHLQTPELESGLASPAFSIADSDGSDNDEAGTRRRQPGQDAPLSGLMAGLHIQTSNLALEETSADREDPVEAEERLPPRSPTENLAKGQLSEEAELFRKARSLGLDGEDSDEATDSAEAPVGSDAQAQLATTTSDTQTSPSTEASLQAVVHDADRTGEQLRADLLKADVPPKSASSSPVTPTKEDAEDETGS